MFVHFTGCCKSYLKIDFDMDDVKMRESGTGTPEHPGSSEAIKKNKRKFDSILFGGKIHIHLNDLLKEQ